MSSRMHNTRTGISDMARTAQEGEIKRAATLKMSAEARLLRHQELERLRKQEEEEYTDDSSHVRPSQVAIIGSRRRSSVFNQGHNGSLTTTSSSRYSSRHSSIEPSSAYISGASAYGNDPRELKRLLVQLEEKYKEVLVINAQLDCEKQYLTSGSADMLYCGAFPNEAGFLCSRKQEIHLNLCRRSFVPTNILPKLLLECIPLAQFVSFLALSHAYASTHTHGVYPCTAYHNIAREGEREPMVYFWPRHFLTPILGIGVRSRSFSGEKLEPFSPFISQTDVDDHSAH
ncbi:hypothetical protein ACTXT7_014174 [Hymenolepis weldensis]